MSSTRFDVMANAPFTTTFWKPPSSARRSSVDRQAAEARAQVEVAAQHHGGPPRGQHGAEEVAHWARATVALVASRCVVHAEKSAVSRQSQARCSGSAGFLHRVGAPVTCDSSPRVRIAIPYCSPLRQRVAPPVRRSGTGRNVAAPNPRASTAASLRHTSLSVTTSGFCARITSAAVATARPV
jgi:hypothetical protein